MRNVRKGIVLLALCAAMSFPSYGGTWRLEGDLWRYQGDDGNDVYNQWVLDDGSYYYLDSRGNMYTGWLQQGNLWYYLDESGRMVTGRQTINGTSYVFLEDGHLQDGPGTEFEPEGALAPYVTSQMCEAGYWNSKYSSASSRLLSLPEITQLNSRIRETSGTNVTDLASLPETFDGTSMVASMTSAKFPSGLYLYGRPVPDSYYEAIWANMRSSAVSGAMPLRYGFAVNHTLMKAYPYSDFLSDSPTDPEWDNLASSAVSVNEPLAVYFFSGDGRYAYVRSTICSGWVPAADIAVCGSKAQWADAQNMTRFLVVTGDKIYLETSALHPEASQKMLAMGTVLELADDSASSSSVDGRLPWNNYVVKLPHRNEDGSFSQRLALIPASRDVSVGYLPFTSANILTQAFKSLGNRYGWGGSLNGQDCSSFVRDVYRCFGLEIPRNTTWQAAMPVQITDLSAMSVSDKEAFLRKLTPGAILQFTGHEMIYLGEANGHFYTINDVSSLVNPLQPEEDSTISRVRSVIINDMSTRRANGQTWLEQISRAIQVWGS